MAYNIFNTSCVCVCVFFFFFRIRWGRFEQSSEPWPKQTGINPNHLFCNPNSASGLIINDDKNVVFIFVSVPQFLKWETLKSSLLFMAPERYYPQIMLIIVSLLFLHVLNQRDLFGLIMIFFLQVQNRSQLINDQALVIPFCLLHLFHRIIEMLIRLLNLTDNAKYIQVDLQLYHITCISCLTIDCFTSIGSRSVSYY